MFCLSLLSTTDFLVLSFIALSLLISLSSNSLAVSFRTKQTTQNYRGGQLMPMPWTSEVNGGFCSNISCIPWIPMNVLINSSINVDKRQGMLQRIQDLTSFRRHNLSPEVGEKRGNYLFHYINDGQIVMERYFERKNRKSKQNQDNDSSSSSLSNKKKRSATSLASITSNEEEDDEKKRSRSQEGIKQEVKEEESDQEKKSIKRSSIISSSRKRSASSQERQDSKEVFKTQDLSLKKITTNEIRAEALKQGISDRSSSLSLRFRFVLFANLGSTPKLKDLRDKFHLGSIKVTSNPKRMRDFLYFRSLKLDAGEAIIAQVE